MTPDTPTIPTLQTGRLIFNDILPSGDTIIINQTDTSYIFFKIPAHSKQALYKGQMSNLYIHNRWEAIQMANQYVRSMAWQDDEAYN